MEYLTKKEKDKDKDKIMREMLLFNIGLSCSEADFAFDVLHSFQAQ